MKTKSESHDHDQSHQDDENVGDARMKVQTWKEKEESEESIGKKVFPVEIELRRMEASLREGNFFLQKSQLIESLVLERNVEVALIQQPLIRDISEQRHLHLPLLRLHRLPLDHRALHLHPHLKKMKTPVKKSCDDVCLLFRLLLLLLMYIVKYYDVNGDDDYSVECDCSLYASNYYYYSIPLKTSVASVDGDDYDYDDGAGGFVVLLLMKMPSSDDGEEEGMKKHYKTWTVD